LGVIPDFSNFRKIGFFLTSKIFQNDHPASAEEFLKNFKFMRSMTVCEKKFQKFFRMNFSEKISPTKFFKISIKKMGLSKKFSTEKPVLSKF
jgi:hypothetical protein